VCVKRLRELEQRYGARFRADAGWSQLGGDSGRMRELAQKEAP